MIEQGLEPLLEQRQPMLHAGHAPAFGQRLVERVLGRGRAECLAIARAEALDRVDVEQRLRRRHQREGLGLVGRALVGGVEAADAVDLVAEEIEPERQLLAGREEVDQRSAHGIFAMLGDGVGALVAERIELLIRASRSIRSPSAMRRVSWRMRNGVSSRCVAALAVATSNCGLSLLGLERAERRQPLRHDAQRRGGAVVGQAVPAGEGQHLDFRREQTARSRQARASPLRRRRSRPRGRPSGPVRGAREVGGEPRQEARRHARKRQRLIGAKDALQRLGHCAIRI